MIPRRNRRAVAALEFALVAPVLLMLFGGMADLGIAMWVRGTLTEAVSQGAYYAFLTGPSVTASNIQSLVTKASGITGVTATVSAPATYCAAGTPATLTAAPSNSTCADGSTPGTYTTISANYTVPAVLPVLTSLGSVKLQEDATVRLQ